MRVEESKGKHVLLVGFQDQDNLGLRYLASSIRRAGFVPRIVTYRSDPSELVSLARELEPLAIGFSLIFQYMAPNFGAVIAALREAGVAAHVTMGGHYPSFDYAEVLERMPGLDSIVRFEGEQTLVELLQTLATGADWRAVHGLAFREGESASTSGVRHSLDDLDALPWPERMDVDYEAQALPTASVLGSRGCPWDCSFCSIRPFYEAQPGPLRRLRKPAAIADELLALHQIRGVRVFLFQDDDFLGGGKRARAWACEVADEILARGLGGKIAFKISARSDEIHRDDIVRLKEAGLTHVYMGVESGDETGLLHLSKRLQPTAHLHAADVLRAEGLSFDFGFMLLEPQSTFDIVRNNVDFLDAFVGDGWTVASFCRMLPYAGAPIAKQLAAEGRLLGTPFEPDYRFLDPRLDLFYEWLLRTFHERNFTNRGLCHLLKSLNFEARLRLGSLNVCTDFDRSWAMHLTAIANGSATNTLRRAIEHVSSHSLEELRAEPEFLDSLTTAEKAAERALTERVVEFYWSIQTRSREALAAAKLPGAFENDWTHSSSEGA
ncbi:MAG: B12-binding domain-containing radical SAM protein [Planctomycetes bacterium]|nr:B12-binding domain-containing radical SAM protein [Planctomycetota bacterium]